MGDSVSVIWISCFEFVSDFVFRNSDFVHQHDSQKKKSFIR